MPMLTDGETMRGEVGRIEHKDRPLAAVRGSFRPFSECLGGSATEGFNRYPEKVESALYESGVR